MELLRQFINSIYPISETSLYEIAKLISFKSFKKGETIINLDEIPEDFYILTSGIVRCYVINNTGKERTKSLIIPNSSIGNLNSLLRKKASNQIFTCLSDCNTIKANYKSFYKLAQKHHDISIFHYKTIEKTYIDQENRIMDLSLLNATEHYKKLLKKHPDIINSINQYHIASYLNITPVQLSRLKKVLLKK